MNTTTKSIWDVVSALEEQMPITISKVEKVIGQRFAPASETPAYVVLESPGFTASGGVVIHKATLMLRPSLQFEDNSGLTLELDGACIGLPQVREHFAELQLVQAPRGRSLEETTVWATQRPWGHLTFAFKEAKPECLFSVVFHKRMV